MDILASRIEPGQTAQFWQDLINLMTGYMHPDRGYTARRAMEKARDVSDYDHLSRFGEWTTSDLPFPVTFGMRDAG